VHNFETPESWKTRSQALTNLSALQEAPVGETLSDTLRLYQKIGTAWLYHLFKHKLAGILADEMGLGKTLQALGLVEALLKNSGGLVLVVCPAGLLTNWQREGWRFTPGLKTRIHHGPSRAKGVTEWGDADIIFTSYTTLTRDIDWIAPYEFVAVIADEAQHIKSRKTQNARSLRALKSKGRFLLTGTPIENSIQDLQSLFEFLLPGYLAKIPKGTNNDERAWYHQRMRQQAAPYILRRSKLQVAPELPEKIEQVIYCDPTTEQKSFYESVRKKSEEDIFNLEMSGAKEGRLKLAAFTQLLRLRQVCADPRILNESFEAEQSAKWLAFREILDEATDGGHRILVFSQFVSVLSLLKQELTQQEIPFCYIDGSTKDRLGEADRFNNNEDIPVFLISLKAGGTGLNLTGADTVIHFDPWWNPAVEAQATDRAHRIGQTKVVTSIKLIVSGSVEEKVLELQRSKADLLKGLFEESEAASTSLGLDELKELMK
ncbi:MAG: DEAD/DEAH box helicase, partial [Verrucomicrobia bacterium]|nr:DEAD/DEAH box helicase [Verrucomicrobiota bacterium]